MNRNEDRSNSIDRMRCSEIETQEYDFIIVGAGAAGCTLAVYLHQNTGARILLIEAGSPARPRSVRVPSEYSLSFGTSLDWGYQTCPQAEMANRCIPLPSGKLVGGSTAINAMIYLEATADDFQRWRQIAGPLWGPEHTQRGYAELERWLQTLATNLRGEGDQAFPATPDLHPITKRVYESASKNGWAACDVSNGLKSPAMGIGPFRRMQRNGQRYAIGEILREYVASTATSPDSKRPPLRVMTQCDVSEVLIENEEATGVRVETETSTYSIRATHGVLVCAGAIASPVLLMKSGIGCRQELGAAGIDCRVDAPWVGKNLSDHLVYPVVVSCPDSAENSAGLEYANAWQTRVFRFPLSREDRIQYARTRTGARQSNIAELGGFFCSKRTESPFSEPKQGWDCQWHITPTHYLEYPRIASEVPSISFGVTPLLPQSVGELRLRGDSASSNGRVIGGKNREYRLEIDPRYLSVESDRTQFIDAIQKTRSFIQDHIAEILPIEEVLPGRKRETDEKVLQSLRRFGTTLYHYVGTCRLSSDRNGPLDERFQVRGLGKLWVCDASSMPTQISANPQATIMMMAIRLGEWIVTGV